MRFTVGIKMPNLSNKTLASYIGGAAPASGLGGFLIGASGPNPNKPVTTTTTTHNTPVVAFGTYLAASPKEITNNKELKNHRTTLYSVGLNGTPFDNDDLPLIALADDKNVFNGYSARINSKTVITEYPAGKTSTEYGTTPLSEPVKPIVASAQPTMRPGQIKR